MVGALTERTRGLSARRLLLQRGELVALAGLLLITPLFPKSLAPIGVYANGIVTGCSLALQAIGLVLVFRANRIVNFAQVQLGGVAGMLFAQMAVNRTPIVGLAKVCDACVPRSTAPVLPPGVDPLDITPSVIQALSAPTWMVTVSYGLSLLVALVVIWGLTLGIYHGIIRRFSDAPRLVLTLVTIALGEVLIALRSGIPSFFPSSNANAVRAPLPANVSFAIGTSRFEAQDVLRIVLAAVAVVGITLYLKRSVVGMALRGVADNPARAETLGVPVRSITSKVWVIAGLLSAAVAILDATGIGATSDAASAGVVRVLAPAVFAAFVSLPVTVVAAIVVALFDQSVLWAFDSASLTEGFLLVVIVGVLLLLRARRSRADSEGTPFSSAREVRPIPVELRSHPTVVRTLRSLTGAGIVVALGLPWILSPSQTNALSVDVIVAMVALSLLVLTGWAGQISLGQFGFAAVGAWTAAVLDLPFPLSLLIGASAGALVAVVIGIPALRLPGLYLAITTVAFAAAVPAVLLNPRYLAGLLPDDVSRPRFLGLDLTDERSFYYLTLVVLALVIGAVVGMKRSRTARALVAARDNEAAAQSFGIDLVRARLTAFAISGFIAAAAGVLFSYATYGVDGGAFGATASAQVFLIAVVGGLGSIAGPLLGAGFISVVGALLTLVDVGELLGPLEQAVLGVSVLVALLLSPGGIGAIVFQVRDAALRRIADREGISVPSLVADAASGSLDGRAPIRPKGSGGRVAVVSRRYRLEGSWVAPSPTAETQETTTGG